MRKNILEYISENPFNVKSLEMPELEETCSEIRGKIIEVVSQNGGHLASNLGVVEIMVALHHVFSIPPDKIIFDVGHQVYPHKILTGRLREFSTLRQFNGITGYPNPQESPADIFTTGHAGTGVSYGLGVKTGEDIDNKKNKIVVFIGDGSLTNGITFEGLNNLGCSKKNVLIILNDNKFSISSTKGSLSYYLTKFISSPVFVSSKEEFGEILSKIPPLGNQIVKFARDIEKIGKYLFIPGIFFEKLGIKYFGPINGHDLGHLIKVLKNITSIEGPVLLHIVTQKGKGYRPAEDDPEKFHSIGRFDVKTGEVKDNEQSTGLWLGTKLIEKAEKKEFYVITAAMGKGLGFNEFSKKFPDRFFDVGIAESHSIIFSSGLAKTKKKVFVGIYSTFLQRTYDQLFHDLCLQNLPVVLLIDRAGIVDGDGQTHQGIYDMGFLRTLPGLKIFAPYSLKNFNEILERSFEEKGPLAIRYSKHLLPEDIPCVFKNKAKILLVGLGSMAHILHKAYKALDMEMAIDFIPVSGIKPIDEKLTSIINKYKIVITAEEGSLTGGFGSSVLEYCNENKINPGILRLGLPDTFIETGSRDVLLEKYRMDVKGIKADMEEFLKNV